MAAGEQEPQLKKMDVSIARLRLLLADVAARDAALAQQARTFAEQREHVVTYALYGDGSLERVLAMLADLDDRLQHTERASQALQMLRSRAQTELESLQLTKGVEEARSLLAELTAQRADPAAPPNPDTEAEIQRLNALIHRASEQAARNLERASRRVQPATRADAWSAS